METQEQIKNGDILAWGVDKGPISFLIAALTGGYYTHVGVAWVLRGRVYNIEAFYNGGVRIKALAECDPADVFSTGVDWTPELEDAALERLGRKYHYKTALKIAARLPLKVYDAEICSMFAAHLLRRGGLMIPDKVVYTPQMLVDALVNAGCRKRHVIPKKDGSYILKE
jgi:hypothetical protein